MVDKKLILVGGGGHCLSVIDSLNFKEFSEVVIIDANIKIGIMINGIRVYGNDSSLPELYARGFRYAFITIGSVGNVAVRKNLYQKVKEFDFQLINIIDKSASLSRTVKLGVGIYIGKNAIINSDSIIYDNCIINSGAIIEHECIINEYVHIAPGVVVLGNCEIGKNTHIGANSSILQNTKIGNNVLVGMGSLVLHCIPSNLKVYGTI